MVYILMTAVRRLEDVIRIEYSDIGRSLVVVYEKIGDPSLTFCPSKVRE